ncbi:hypothetical protein ACHAW5_002333 [Stephanodiscus triporus]|uniref:Uncharacterized protein n=1 Tax=Stephanodiscus triporus TaxID=2934178 RepID=A0ABD3N2V4_9STRA
MRIGPAASVLAMTSAAAAVVVAAFSPDGTSAAPRRGSGGVRGSPLAAAASSSSSSPPAPPSAAGQRQQWQQQQRDSDFVPPLRRHPPRRIALLVEPTPFTHVSGYANRFNEMLRYLSKAGDKVDILTVDSKTPREDLPTEAFGHPIEHTQGFVFPLYDHISLTIDLPEMKGARMMERNRPDLIHVTSPGFMLFAGLFYARVMRVPLLLSYHTHLPLYGRNYMGYIPGIEEMAWAALRFVHGRADLTLVTSPQMKEEMERNGIPRVDVWRKGIDTVRFHPRYASPDMRNRMTDDNSDDFLMVYVGRLGAEKRLRDLRPTLERCPGARLCIVGKGPQEAELREYFAGTNTVFTGQLRGDELSSAFASADVFVMPSDTETLGFVVLESMASGVPVVGCAAGGIPDLIRDGDTGYLVPPGDVDGYADRVRTLMEDTVLRREMGTRARTEAERWGWEAATSVLRNVQYEKAMINFHSRAFGGFGRPRTTSVWRLLRMRIARVLGRLGIPGFRRNGDVSCPI